jgi:hypothetical protein
LAVTSIAPGDARLTGAALDRAFVRGLRPVARRLDSMKRSPTTAAGAASRLSFSDALDQMQDGEALLAAWNAMEGLHETQRMRMGEQLAPGQIGPPAAGGGAAVEQGGERHIERAGDLTEATRADAVGAVLVLLDLLERHPEMLPKVGLGQAALQPADPDVSADQSIHWKRSFRHAVPRRLTLENPKSRTFTRTRVAYWNNRTDVSFRRQWRVRESNINL